MTPASRRATRPRGEEGRLFVSHASEDEAIADALADLLRLGTDLPRRRIFCTSLPGMGIPEGEDNYIGYLRRQLQHAVLVLPLITPSFLESQVCLVELGAMWAMELPAFPVIVPPSTYPELEAILGKVQCARIDQPGSLARLKDRVAREFNVEAPSDAWEAKRTDFLRRWKRLKADVASGTRVSAVIHARATERIMELEQQVTALEEVITETQQQLEAVSALKDQHDVAPLRRAKKEDARFSQLVDQAARMMSQLPDVVRIAIYESAGQGSAYFPEEYRRGQADAAVREDHLRFDEDEGAYYLNEEDPDVNDAVDAVNELFQSEWSDQLLDAFKAEHRKGFSHTSAATWRVLGLL